MKLEEYLACLNLVALLLMGILIYDYFTAEGCASCQLYNPKAKWGVNGIYHSPDYYCVWTKNRGACEIADTETHEKCHALIDKRCTHFCGNSTKCQ